jgi:geranylgeranyl diphosphate synthase, type I
MFPRRHKMNSEGSKYSELNAAIAERGSRLRGRVKEILLSGVNDPELRDIMEKIGSSWQDSFRPALTSFSCEAVGGQPEAAEDAGLIFTLASMGFANHDDIIDRSTHKRLKTTILGVYGLETALLVGDLLIVKGWTTLQSMLRKDFSNQKVALVIETYGDLNVEICEAELVDARSKHKLDVTLEHHQQILWKAMAETEACTRIGAILGDGTEEQIQALAEYGRYLGVNSRLLDEVKDCLNLEGNLPNRLKYESVPLPLLFAAQSSLQRQAKIKAITEKRDISSLDCRDLTESCFDSEAFHYVCSLSKENMEKAALCMDSLESNEGKKRLLLLLKRSYDEMSSLFE